MKLSEIISSYRNRMGISQREFARQCGLSNSYISFIEKEYNPRTKKPIVPTIVQYKKLADAMGITLQKLFEDLDGDAPVDLSATIPADQLSPEEYRLVILFRGADSRAKSDAIRMLEEHQKKDTKESAI